MTPAQSIQVRLSECRQRLNTLLQVENRSEDETAEMEKVTAEVSKREPELRAALASEPDPQEVTTATADPETRERLELRSKTGLADFLSAAAGGREVSGAAKEYAASVGCSPLNRLPLDIFRNGQPEVRAITTGPAVDGPVEPAVPYVFQRSAAASLGIQMPTHGAGAVQVPRVTTAPPADTLAKDGSAPSTAAAIALDSQTPKRISGQFEVRIEDMAVYPQLEAVLGESIRGSLSNELDNEVFNGDAAGLNGLFLQAADVAVAASVETYATGIARFAALVDGEHAYSLADLRCVVGPSTYAVFMGLDLRRRSVGRLPRKQARLVPGLQPDAVQLPRKVRKASSHLNGGPSPIRVYVWSALEIIQRSLSAPPVTGKITLTATALVSEVYIPHTT